MSLSIMNNIPSLMAQNQLGVTEQGLQKTLFQLSSGSRINSGADDAAGLAISDGLKANITSLQQSVYNAGDGVNALQVADGALAQVTTLLNRAVTLATEAATGTVSSAQRGSIDNEFQQILNEINSIGTSTNFNGASVFTATATSIFLSDGVTNAPIAVTVGNLSTTSIGTTTLTLGADALTTVGDASSGATKALADINSAIAAVAASRGNLGAFMNRLQAASNNMQSEQQNLTQAVDTKTSADIGQTVAAMSKFQILQQTGMSALAQANSSQQAVLKLLQ